LALWSQHFEGLDQPLRLAQHTEVGALVFLKARYRIGAADDDRLAVVVREITRGLGIKNCLPPLFRAQRRETFLLSQNDYRLRGHGGKVPFHRAAP
jgi:hypothetical protein